MNFLPKPDFEVMLPRGVGDEYVNHVRDVLESGDDVATRRATVCVSRPGRVNWKIDCFFVQSTLRDEEGNASFSSFPPLSFRYPPPVITE